MTERMRLRQQYDQKRLDRDILIRQRKQTLFQRDERFVKQEQAHRLQVAEVTQAGLDAGLSDEQIDGELASRHAAFYQAQAELLREHGLAADYFNPPYECSDCEDTGRLGTEDCHCFKQALAQVIYQDQSLFDSSRSLATWTSEIFPDDQKEMAEHIHQALIRFVDHMPSHPGQSLIFQGVPGVGKTYLSSALAGSLAERGYLVIYQTAPDLFDVDYADRREHRLRLRNCDMLIIDDLGKETLSDYHRSELFTLINHRVNTHKSFLISTNLSLRELKNRYHDDIFSRLTAVCEYFQFAGPGIRSQRPSE